MRKIRVVQLIGIALFLVYMGLIVADILFGYLGNYGELVLSILLAIISINLIYKGMLIRSSSTLWFAVSLILFAIAIVVFELLKVSPLDYYWIFSIIPIISSLINVAIFQNLIYIKVIILNISICIPIFIKYFSALNVWWIVAIAGVSVLMGILLCRCINFSKENV